MPGEIGLSPAARAQAIRSYKFWAIYLVLRLRQLEQQTLDGTLVIGQLPSLQPQTDSHLLPEISLLKKYGLALPATIPSIEAVIPSIPLDDHDQHYFHAGLLPDDSQYAALNVVRLHGDACDVMEFGRSAEAHLWYLREQQECFNRLLSETGTENAVRAAAIWSLINGGQPQPWRPIPAHLHIHYRPSQHEQMQDTGQTAIPIASPDAINEVDFNGF